MEVTVDLYLYCQSCSEYFRELFITRFVMHRWEKANDSQSVARPRDSIDTGLKHFSDKNEFNMDNCIHTGIVLIYVHKAFQLDYSNL